jgi:hypothetical protein
LEEDHLADALATGTIKSEQKQGRNEQLIIQRTLEKLANLRSALNSTQH